MKKQERYKLLNYVKRNYSKQFNRNYKFKKLSKKALYKLLKENKHSSMCEWSYCCYGLYQNCWQNPVEEGVWDYTQKKVDNIIKHTIDSTANCCKKDNRILYYEDENGVQIIIIARDVKTCDYFIYFTNKKED